MVNEFGRWGWGGLGEVESLGVALRGCSQESVCGCVRDDLRLRYTPAHPPENEKVGENCRIGFCKGVVAAWACSADSRVVVWRVHECTSLFVSLAR